MSIYPASSFKGSIQLAKYLDIMHPYLATLLSTMLLANITVATAYRILTSPPSQSM